MIAMICVLCIAVPVGSFTASCALWGKRHLVHVDGIVFPFSFTVTVSDIADITFNGRRGLWP